MNVFYIFVVLALIYWTFWAIQASAERLFYVGISTVMELGGGR
ncbi:MAG: hypothetical protein ACU0A6_01110 [Shimia sp.]